MVLVGAKLNASIYTYTYTHANVHTYIGVVPTYPFRCLRQRGMHIFIYIYICIYVSRAWWVLEVPRWGVFLVPWVRLLVLCSPPAHRGHSILPLFVSITSLRRSSLRVVAIMTAADGRDGPGEDSVPRVIGRNH